MPRPIDGIEPRAREKFKELDRQIAQIKQQLAVEQTSIISSTGYGLRAGPPSERGNASERYPELYIQVDVANTKVKWFLTIPLNTAENSYDWVELGKYTLS